MQAPRRFEAQLEIEVTVGGGLEKRLSRARNQRRCCCPVCSPCTVLAGRPRSAWRVARKSFRAQQGNLKRQDKPTPRTSLHQPEARESVNSESAGHMSAHGQKLGKKGWAEPYCQQSANPTSQVDAANLRALTADPAVAASLRRGARRGSRRRERRGNANRLAGSAWGQSRQSCQSWGVKGAKPQNCKTAKRSVTWSLSRLSAEAAPTFRVTCRRSGPRVIGPELAQAFLWFESRLSNKPLARLRRRRSRPGGRDRGQPRRQAQRGAMFAPREKNSQPNAPP